MTASPAGNATFTLFFQPPTLVTTSLRTLLVGSIQTPFAHLRTSCTLSLVSRISSSPDLSWRFRVHCQGIDKDPIPERRCCRVVLQET
jgi:hypothetical protein